MFHIPPPPFLDDPALRSVLAALPDARLVGGAVRDTLAHRPVHDIDLATPHPPEAVIHALDAAGLKHAPTGLQHGTVTAIAHGRGFEVTTLRRDETTDGRHAHVAWTTDWHEDAARRDFTINAMSMRPDGTVFDYFGGQADLAAGHIRFVGSPARRIAEDHLRVLRYFRFHGRYGTTPPDPDTAQALRDGAATIPRLSVERVWSELKRILALPDPTPTIRLMHTLGVLQTTLPGPTDLDRLARLIARAAPPDPLLRLAALQPGTEATARLKLSRAETTTLEALATPPPDPTWTTPNWPDDALRRALADEPPEHLIARAWLQDTDTTRLRTRLAQTPRPTFPLAGRDALALGIPPGPKVGLLLEEVRQWWRDNGCRPTPEACRSELASRA